MTDKELFYDKKPGFGRLKKEEQQAVHFYAEGYKNFLDEGKTERDAAAYMVRQAEAHGFRPYKRGEVLQPGDRIYKVNREKGIVMAIIGQESLAKGAQITAAHIDSPRIDIRTIPVYEDDNLAFFKTHYYGGIKKYQWTTIPLELRGVVSRYTDRGLENIHIHIGDKPEDPVFVITDLLPHLASQQMQKPMVKGIEAEKMNILIGSVPDESEEETNNKVKRAVMKFLNNTYGITEEDFLSAEIAAVPAFNARDIGFDRSMIGAYGHDDRVCAYPAATALFDLDEIPAKTAICLLVDKEEIGSEGVTGMKSQFFDMFLNDLCRSQNVLREDLCENSTCLSADVSNAYDPNYPEVSDKRNDAKMNCGLIITKYTGARGKSETNDASAELMAKIRYIMRDICWQTGQLGKVDQGGGGTVAMYMASRNIETVDAGVPVLSMHAPFEVIAKLDLYMAYQGFGAFYRFEK